MRRESLAEDGREPLSADRDIPNALHRYDNPTLSQFTVRANNVLETLNEQEARVIGCLIEKSIVTPDQYPLTLNALTNACNQKSSRDPVMSLQQGEVQHTVRALEARHLVRTEQNFKSTTEKYSQRFCNTRYSDLQLDTAQVAIICLMLLRGAQTPGELRARSGRLHTFADNAEVVVCDSGMVR